MTDIAEVDTTVAIVDGRVAMSADGKAEMYVDIPEHKPLSETGTHATLRFVGDDYRAHVELDGTDLDTIVETLTSAKETNDA